MLKVLAPTLKGGLEIAFLLAVFSAYLEGTERQRLFWPLKWGSLLGIAISPALAYGVASFLEREIVEGITNFLALLLTLGLIPWIGWTSANSQAGTEQDNGKAGVAIGSLVFLATLVMVALRGMDIALSPTRVFMQTTGLLSTELLATLGAGLLGLLVAALVGVILHKVAVQVRREWLGLLTVLSLSILLVRQATTVVQIALVRGILPLSDWLFRLIVPLVNNYTSFYYALFAATCALVLLAMWEWRRRRHIPDGLNPAQRRKLRSTYRRIGTLIATVSVLLLLVILADASAAIYANRPIRLSPATPVISQGDRVTIPLDSVNDGQLHRFSFEAPDGTVVSFLVIHKGSGIFGVALDACTFCGIAGYRQEGENVICNKCGAAINIATIGFPGGCNPIPLDHHQEGGSLVVPVEALEAATGVFSR